MMGYTIEDARQEMYEDELEKMVRERELFRIQQEFEEIRSKHRKDLQRTVGIFSAGLVGFCLIAALFMFVGESDVSNVLARLLAAPIKHDGDNSFAFIGLVLTAAGGVAAGALFYLRPSANRYSGSESIDFKRYVDSKFNELRATGVSNASEIDSDQRKEVVDLIRKRLEGEAVTSIFEMLKAEAYQASRRESLETRLLVTRKRLGDEVIALAKRGNLNLVLGILTTIAGLSALAYAVVTAPPTQSVPDLLGHFLPRLSLSLLIEVFAYFFLRLYKQSLSEIKYFQNELTNVESLATSAMFALEAGNMDLLGQIALQISKTERNFILEKGQSTVDLERDRISANSSDRVLELVAAALRGVPRSA